MAILFKAYDPLNRTITCTLEQWNNHVLEDAAMRGREANVQRAIEWPDVGIRGDVDFKNREVYYAHFGEPDMPRYLKVVVEFENEEFGNLITAFPTANSKRGETELIWIPSVNLKA